GLRRAWGWLRTRRQPANAASEPTLAPGAEVSPTTGSAPRPGMASEKPSPGDISAVSAKSRVMLAELTRCGWNIGAAPYGYRLRTVRVIDPDGRVRRRSRLAVHPVEAAVVRQIFTWRAASGLTI